MQDDDDCNVLQSFYFSFRGGDLEGCHSHDNRAKDELLHFLHSLLPAKTEFHVVVSARDSYDALYIMNVKNLNGIN